MLKDLMEKIRFTQEKLVATQIQDNEYMDSKLRNVNFDIGEKVFFKVSPMKGVINFGMKGKLSLRYSRPFEVFKGVGSEVYMVVFSPSFLGFTQYFTYPC